MSLSLERPIVTFPCRGNGWAWTTSRPKTTSSSGPGGTWRDSVAGSGLGGNLLTRIDGTPTGRSQGKSQRAMTVAARQRARERRNYVKTRDETTEAPRRRSAISAPVLRAPHHRAGPGAQGRPVSCAGCASRLCNCAGACADCTITNYEAPPRARIDRVVCGMQCGDRARNELRLHPEHREQIANAVSTALAASRWHASTDHPG